MKNCSKEIYELEQQQHKKNINVLKERRKVVKTRINDCYDKKMYILAFITVILGGSLMGVGLSDIDVPLSDIYIISGVFCFPLSILDAWLGKRINKETDLEELKKQRKEIEKLIKNEKDKYNNTKKRRVLRK